MKAFQCYTNQLPFLIWCPVNATYVSDMSSQNKSWRQSISLELEATMPSKITFELCHFCYRHTKSICYLMYGTTEIAKDSTFVAKCKHFPKNCISRKNFHICYAFIFFDPPSFDFPEEMTNRNGFILILTMNLSNK